MKQDISGRDHEAAVVEEKIPLLLIWNRVIMITE